jgi:hypothetical protein
MALVQSVTIVPATTHTRALLAGSTYGADASSYGGYLRVKLPAPPADNRIQRVQVGHDQTILPATTHTRTLLAGTTYGADASSYGGYLRTWFTIGTDFAGGTLYCDSDAECSWTAAPLTFTWTADADAGMILYGRASAFWECDAEASSDWAGHATEWHVSGLRMDADAGAEFEGHPTGVGTLYMDADAGFEVWPRLRAIAESCLGAQTDPSAGEAAELGNYVY